MCAHNTQTSNVTVLHAVRRIFFHFRQDVADDAGVIVGGFLGARNVDCDEGELWPGEGMVEVVFHEITRWGLAWRGRGKRGKGMTNFSGRLVILAC